MGAKLSDIYPDAFGDSAFGDLEFEGVLGEWERSGGFFTLRISRSESDGLEVLVTRGEPAALTIRSSELFPALEEVRRNFSTGYRELASWPPLENPAPFVCPLGILGPQETQYGRCWADIVKGVHLRLYELRGGWALEANNLVWSRKMTVARPSLEDVYDVFRGELAAHRKSGERAGTLLDAWAGEVSAVEGRPWWERLGVENGHD